MKDVKENTAFFFKGFQVAWDTCISSTNPSQVKPELSYNQKTCLRECSDLYKESLIMMAEYIHKTHVKSNK